METVDIVLLVFLGIGMYRGFKTGLLMQLLGIIAFFLAIIGGFHMMYWGVDWLGQYLDGYDEILPVISFIGIFFITIVVINLIGKGLKSLLDMTLLGSFDNISGAITGLLKWALVLSLMIWIVETYGNYPLTRFHEDTIIFPLVAAIAPFLFDSLALMFPYLQDLTWSGNDYEQAMLLFQEKVILTRDFSKIVV